MVEARIFSGIAGYRPGVERFVCFGVPCGGGRFVGFGLLAVCAAGGGVVFGVRMGTDGEELGVGWRGFWVLGWRKEVG